ncbi:MAG: T9SS type A sorting domain-containing protein [Ignavibacterium sp.]
MVSNATTFRQAGGTIGGSGNLVINGNFIFESGIHGGTGTTTIASGANLDFTTSSTKTIIRTFVVDGVLTVIGAGSVSITSGGQLINNGTVEIQNSNSFGSAGGNIVNNGNFIRTTQTGTATVSGSFTNNGVIEILIGTLSFTSSSLNNTAQGEIKGLGTLSPGSNFTNDGAVSPGTSPGVLKVSGNYPQSSSGVLNIEIGGFDLNNRDSLSVTQQAQLNGTLNIVFTNNFTPQIGDVFPFLSYQSRSGEFSQVNFPANVIGYIQYLSNGARIVIDSTTSVDEEDLDQPDSEKNKIPTTYELAQNYPNPFNPTTVISWQSPVSSHQTLKVYDVLGNQVATLVDEFREAGMFEITFRASNLSSGIYFYKLQAGDFVQTKKMILLK